MKVVVGLGNPGSRYRGTRHNVGFEVVAELARRHSDNTPRLRFDAEIVEAGIGGEKILLVAPQPFMNASGRVVQPLAAFYKLDHDNLVVVCDDMNLETGRIRWRGSGSAGGQKGLNDIIQRLGTERIPRLRIGIDRPGDHMDSTAWVLSRFRDDERELMDPAIERAADSIEVWIRDGLEAAMNQFNLKT